MAKELDESTKEKLVRAQLNEITEYRIYRKLADYVSDEENSKIMREIADDELKHYDFWKEYTGEEVKPSWLKVWFFYGIAIVFGITFGIKLMEQGEEDAQETYSRVAETIPEAESIVRDEDEHEDELLEMIDEERLNYVGSVVLGLNDALVELTGTLAGLTLAMRDTRLIAMAGLITGIAAAMSMGASEYLSTKSESGGQNPVKASSYTGLAYITTVILLILPYLLLPHYFTAFLVTLAVAVVVIFLFNYYVSVAQGVSFRDRFTEMAGISLGVAGLSFVIGFIIRHFMGVEI